MTDTDMAQMPIAGAEKPIWSNYFKDVVWPALGLGFAFLCTIVWCAFLIWILFKLFA
jgi:hypothetical protein